MEHMGFWVPPDRQDAALEEAECFLQKRLEQAKSEQERMAAYHELGVLYRSAGQYDRSLKAFEAALDAEDAEPDEQATILNNMAGTCRLMGDYQRSIALFEKARELCCGEEETGAYVGVLKNLSLVYQETKQVDLAIVYLRQALEIMERMPGYAQETAVAYNNLTALYHAAGDRTQALFCVNRALQAFEKCPEAERVRYAAVLNSLAGFLYTEGDCPRALQLYRKSAEYTLRFSGETEEYALTCQNMRWVYERMGDREGAVSALERAARVYMRQLGGEHERTRAAVEDLMRLREEL